MKTNFPLRYKIFSVVFFIQLLVSVMFIYSFVKSFKKEKLISAYELNATTISELKNNINLKITSAVEKLKLLTHYVEKNQLPVLSILDQFDLQSNNSVEAIYQYEITSTNNTFDYVNSKARSNSNLPDLKAYFAKLSKRSSNIWNLELKDRTYVIYVLSINFEIEKDKALIKKESIYFILLNKFSLFSLSNKNEMASVVVFGKDGQVMSSEGVFSKEDLADLASHPLILESKAQKGLIQVTEEKFQKKNYVISTQAHEFIDLIITTLISTEDAYIGVKKVYQDAILLGILAVVFSYVLTTFFASTITMPLSYLTKMTQLMSKGELSVDINVTSKDEIGVLAVNFKQMANELRNSKDDLLSLNRDLEAKVQERTKQLEELTIKDPLTGAFNRRYFDQRMAEEIIRAKRNNTSVGLLYLDIDHFKKYNDQNGHPEGDQLLINFVKSLKDVVRNTDCLCRLGGEEFCIIAINATIPGLKVFADKVCKSIYETDFKFGEKQPMGRLSCSIGVSSFPEMASDSETIVKTADEALYVAKQSGRNRWVLAENKIADTAV